MLRVVAVTGRSGSGKTTAIETLIRHFVAQGRTVGAIKHTHHQLNTDDRGDTVRFRRAGASPVILAGLNRAVVFSDEAPAVVRYQEPRDLLTHFASDFVFVEGFASFDAWPRIELAAGAWRSPAELIARAAAIAPIGE